MIVNPTQKILRKQILKKEALLAEDGAIVSKWKDKRGVLMISNMYTHKMVEISNKRGEKKMKPSIIRDYNKGMSGIDRADQR